MTNRRSAAQKAAAKRDAPNDSGEPENRRSQADPSDKGVDDTLSFMTRRNPGALPEQKPAGPDPAQPAAAPGGRPKAKSGTARPKTGPKQRKKKQQAAKTSPAQEPSQKPSVDIKPTAGPARMKRRHWGVLASFIFMAVVPWVAVVAYLFMVAEDQYHSVAGFTVRSQEQTGANDLIGGLVQFAGGSVASDSDILYEFIQSQEMVQSVNDQVDLRGHYSQYWPDDWAYSIWPDATQEDLIWYWNRMIGVSYDSSTGLTQVQVKAFDPDTAQEIAKAIVAESQSRINELNLQAREDAMRYAQADLEEAVEKLKNAREALTQLRTKSQIVDPETDMQTRMGVMTSLQQQLAEALVEYDLLLGTTNQNDPRLKETSQRIEVIRERIATERRNFATSSTETGGVSQNYPSLISEFERLTVDREYAEKAYFAALTALEAARDEASRQSRYLATYIKPTMAEASEYPKRFVVAGLVGLFLLLTWSILVLIYYSIRDRS